VKGHFVRFARQGPATGDTPGRRSGRGIGGRLRAFSYEAVCGFVFDPQVSEEATRGNLVVLPTKMNPDLAMGEAAPNLSAVF
jgi:hypothetical protein